MKVTRILATLILFFCSVIAFAQKDSSFKKITITGVKENAFDKVIDYLQAKDYFIESVDKQAGFIKAKVFLPYSKMLSAKAGERRTMNFILRSAGNKTDVTLNIYSEEAYLSNSGRYFRDKGIMTDPVVYQEILADLQKTVGE